MVPSRPDGTKLNIYSQGQVIETQFLKDGEKIVQVRNLVKKLESYKSLYPQGIVSLSFIKDSSYYDRRKFKISNKVSDSIKLVSRGLSKDLSEEKIALMKSELELAQEKMNALKDEIGSLKEVIINNNNLYREDKKLLLSCFEENKSLETKYYSLKASQDTFDVAINSQGSKRLAREYNEIKQILTKVNQE